MTNGTVTGWPNALSGIAVGLLWTQVASGQATAPDAGERGDCMPSPEPHECAERCPSFDTCYIEDDAQLYYRVKGERFDCDGLDCTRASAALGDYCCERGEYAPSRGGGGGGCGLTSLASSAPAEPREGSNVASACLGALGLLVACRRARPRRRRADAARGAAR